MRNKIMTLLIAIASIATATIQAEGTEQLAFPGAEGFGRYTTGGRGGKVYYVTSLEDCSDSDLKEGTLRWALHVNSDDATPRTILFKVGGTIHLKDRLKTNCKNVSILGQSAPGGGICIADNAFIVTGHNTIIRYIRFRCGDKNSSSLSSLDVENCKNVIVDHCSMSWSIEENVTMYDNDYTTMQWCIMSEPLYNSYNKKGARAYGAQWGGEYSTFHHNIFIHCAARIPQVYGVDSNDSNPETHDFHVNQENINNVMYNGFGSEATYNGRLLAPNVPDAYCRINHINNYYKPGPITYGKEKQAKNHFFCTIYNTPNTYLSSSNDPKNLAWFIDGNKYESNEYINQDVTAINNDNWYNVNTSTGGVKFKGSFAEGATYETHKLNGRSVNSGVEMQSADEAYAMVLKNAGAQWPSLDEVDARVLAEAAGLQEPQFVGKTQPTYTGLIDSQDELKPADADDTWTAWPDLSRFPDETIATDTDEDGMPDEWEDANGLNKNDAADGAATESNGYTNLENYLNSIIEGTKAPSNLKAIYNADKNAILTWIDNSDNEVGFQIDRADITSATDTVFIKIADIDADAETYTDNTADYNKKYIYRISATTAMGKSNAVRTTLYANPTLAVNEAKGVDGLSIAPNPIKDNINVRSEEALKSITVADVSGKIVIEADLKGQNSANINVGGIVSGVYVVTVTATNGNKSTIKTIKE